jgi:hypothetical protein
MAFVSNMETLEQEKDRLSQYPEGSIYHDLSKLPVTILERPEGLLILLTRMLPEYRVVVVPVTCHTNKRHYASGELRQRFSEWWDCIVVSSDHPMYPVGSYQVSISAAELARGEKLSV